MLGRGQEDLWAFKWDQGPRGCVVSWVFSGSASSLCLSFPKSLSGTRLL